MPLLRALVTIPMFTGAPEDAASNTLYFQSAEGTSVAATVTAANARLSTFYGAIGSFYSKAVSTTFTVKYYDMADPTPRLPVGFGSASVSPNGAALNMPEEVAVVLAFNAAPISGANQARRRGRIYLGPLNQTLFTLPTTAGFTQVASAGRTTVANAAAAMANPATNVANWVMYSEADNLAHPIAGGWIDVQPDTQRRRGHKVAGRTSWTTP